MKVDLSGVSIGKKEIKYVLDVLASGKLSFGKYTEKFEKYFKAFTKRKYAIAVSSGTAGLFLALKCLNINENDEIITTPFSFIASSNVIIHNNATPVFVDINPKTLCISEKGIEKIIEKKYRIKNGILYNKKNGKRLRGILSVNIFGSMPDYKKILKITKKYSLFLIEDSCESLGSYYGKQPSGSFGDISVFAFYANKQITTGEGGIVLTDNKKLYNCINALKNQGRDFMDLWLNHSYLGYNFRIDEMSTALGTAQMERLETILKKRNSNANYYNNKLNKINEIEIPNGNDFGKTGWFVYVIQVDKKHRNKLMQYLLKYNIQIRPYFTPIHLQKFYKEEYGYKIGAFPITEEIAKRTIALPFFTEISRKEQDYVIKTIKKYFNYA